MLCFCRLNLIVLLLCLALLPNVHAQEAAESSAAQETVAEAEPKDKLGRDTPRGSIAGFLIAADENDFVKAIEFLDLRNLPKRYRNAQPTQLARMLSVVIEREIWIDLDEISDDPDGEIGDGLPEYRDELGRLKGDEGESYVLLMQRVPDNEGGRIWKISNATTSTIADLYSEFGYGPISQAVSEAVPDIDVFGIELFKWILMLGAGLAAYPVLMAFGYLLARIFSRPSSDLYPRVKRFFILPVALLGVNSLMNYVVANLGLGISAQQVLETHTINTIFILWVLIAFAGLMRDYYAKRLSEQGKQGAMVLLRPITQSIQIVLTLIVFLIWLENTGFDITTILAGLGVGGIAVALALQKPMEDIFGAVSLYTQQPIKIGDFCRIGGETGNVEEIGLRMTRLRTLDNSLISIPNAKLAEELIDNYSARGRIRYKPILRLRVDTSRAQIERILQKLREMLANHDKVDQEGMRVRFQTIGDDALNIGIIAHVKETDFSDFLIVAEDLNMKVLDILDEEGVTLAVPSHNVFMQQPEANVQAGKT
jgi:MscS family membrane protein